MKIIFKVKKIYSYFSYIINIWNKNVLLLYLFKRWDPNKLLPKQDFDRKVAEADAYLQLLIDQIKLIEQKQQAVPEGDETNEQRYEEILKQANAMLNSVKHMIVQLQIAKVIKLSFSTIKKCNKLQNTLSL